MTIVVKVGGALLAYPDRLDAVLHEIAAASRHVGILVVPGGGPFADAVRAVDARVGLSDDAAHWMAVLAMDQHAHLIASRMHGAVRVSRPDECVVDPGAGPIPVLAPYRWLRQVDPVPHTWDVTSDSIAAWVAGAIGAQRLVLIKPPGAAGVVTDAFFARALPAQVAAEVVPGDRIDTLRQALRCRS